MLLKNLRRILILLFVLLVALGGLLWHYSHTKSTQSAFMLNTYVSITAYGGKGSEACRAALEEVGRIESLMSAYLPGSDVSNINANAGDGAVTVHPETFDIIQKSVEISRLTNGAFDITTKPVSDLWGVNTPNAKVPDDAELQKALSSVGYENLILDANACSVRFAKKDMSIDLGGIAKGYAGDAAAKVLNDSGVSGIVDLGGNIVVCGQRPQSFSDMLFSLFKKPAANWVIGIQKPFAPQGEAIVKLSAKSGDAVVSSGSYERNFTQDGVLYHHIFDPKTGKNPVHNLQSVSIICPSSATADALATGIFVLGKQQGIAVAKAQGVGYIVIDANGNIDTNMNISRLDPQNND